MKLIDMLAGKTESDDPGDRPSGVRITFEPSAGLLKQIDALANDSKCSREEAAAAFAATGYVSKKVVSGLFGAITETAKKFGPRDDEADCRTQELRLAEVTGKKEGFEEAAKACDAIAAACGNDSYAGTRKGIAERCAERVRELKKAFVDEAMARLKVKPSVRPGPEDLARLFHETYEQLAPSFGYETREASRKPWSEVPENNRKLMIAVCERILTAIP